MKCTCGLRPPIPGPNREDMIPARVPGTLEGEDLLKPVVTPETGVDTAGAGLEETLLGVEA